LALLESGTPSSTISVPNEASCPALGPPLVSVVAPDDVGTLRSPTWATPSSPGGESGTPGTSSSTPARLAADWFWIASRPMTLAVPSSPAARPLASAVTVTPSSRSAARASATSRSTVPDEGTVSATRVGA
jgi:hypothetical protein